MVLDTNVKEFRYSVWTKIICIILCFVSFVGAAGLSLAAVTTSIYVAESDSMSSWTDSSMFRQSFLNDTASIVSNAYASTRTAQLRKQFEDNRARVLDEAYKQYLEQRGLIKNQETYEEEDIDDNTVVTTMKEPEDVLSVDVFDCSDKEDGKDVFEFNPHAIYDDYVNYGNDERRSIEDAYDRHIEDVISRYNDGGISTRSYCNSMFFTAQYDKDEPVGNEDFEIKDIYDKDVYFSVENGEMRYAGIPKETAETIYKNVFEANEYARNTNLYIYFNDYPGRNNVITNMRYWNDTYTLYQDFFYFSSAVHNRLGTIVPFAVILSIISLITGIYYLLITGKKSRDENAKLYFIDKIPFELHLGLWIALCTGIFIFGANISFFADIFSRILYVFLMIFAACVWVLLFEFCASVSRYCRSGRKVYENLLVYKLGVLLVKGGKKIAKGVKEAAKVLTYKPEKFEQNVIILSLLYAIGNLLAILMIIGMFYANAVIAILFVIADVGVNIYLLIKVVQYVAELDKIIVSASRHEDIQANIESLPLSLKTLAESVKYTNEELSAAVAKAVRDERLKAELITNVSHDLKTPLTSIITYVDLLSKCDIEDEKAQEYIRVLDEKGAKLKRLIDDLIEASKVTTGNVKVNAAPINLYELCLQAVGESQQEFEKAALELLTKGDETPPIVFADGAKAFRIMENLLTNARKYSAPHTRVYVSVYREANMGVFEIKNISAQALDISPDELTQRFVRGDKSRNQDGNGLGLSIAKELCRVQNGRLDLSIDGDLFKAKVYLPLSNK